MLKFRNEMMTIHYYKLKSAAILFAALPLLLFFGGWLNIPAAFIFGFHLVAAMAFYFRSRKPDDGERNALLISKGMLIAVIAIAFLWCLAAGQGGFIHQTNDHATRNRIMWDLTLKDWPVVYHEGNDMLCYYIAYWLVPCGLGKVIYQMGFGAQAAMHICNTTLLIWSTIGITITLLLVLLLTQKTEKYHPLCILLAAVLFILFSGMDIVGLQFQEGYWQQNAYNTQHLEWWATFFQFSSNSTLLFWVYNQTIPVWPLILCLINERTAKDLAVLGALAFPYGPFPFVGMVVLGLLRACIMMWSALREKRLLPEIRTMFSFQNVLIIIAVMPVHLLYFTANVMVSGHGAGAENTGFRILDYFHQMDDPGVKKWLIPNYIMFVILEFGIWVILLMFRKGSKATLIGVTVYLLITPLLQLGSELDFGMRVSIPGIVYLGVMMIRAVIEDLPEKGETGSFWRKLSRRTALGMSLVILGFGAVTPFSEIKREIEYTYRIDHPNPDKFIWGTTFNYDIVDSLEFAGGDGNFFAQGYQESNFYQYLCKH